MSDKFDFDRAVFDHYMERGRPGTAKEIAEYSGVSIGKVRKAISESRYRSDCTSIDVEVRGQNYSRSVDAYQPSLSQLRQALQESLSEIRGSK